jgi:hypothetical protein
VAQGGGEATTPAFPSAALVAELAIDIVPTIDPMTGVRKENGAH